MTQLPPSGKCEQRDRRRLLLCGTRWLQDAELDADVAAGRAGVRADLVGLLGELADLIPLHAGHVDDERDDQAERVALRADADLRGHRRVAEWRVLPAGHQP